MYFLDRGVRTEPAKAIAIAEEYLSRQETIDPEIREQALAFLKDQDILWQWSANDRAIPYLGVEISDHFELLRKSRGSGVLERVHEALLQGSIYGNYKNFYGETEAFAYAHERAHRASANSSHSGVVLEKLSELAHAILILLTQEKKLSRKETFKLWVQFEETNKQIVHLVKKFEPVEEIFATYLGLRWCPIEVRNKVEARVIKKLEEKQWNKAYEAFAEQCDKFDDPVDEAGFIFDPVCRMLEQIDNVDGAEFLSKFLETEKNIWPIVLSHYKRIEKDNDSGLDTLKLLALAEREAIEEVNPILEQAGIPKDVYWTVTAARYDIVYPHLGELSEAIVNNDFSRFKALIPFSLQQPILIGRPAEKYISITELPYDGKVKPKFSTETRAFCESLRQQLSAHCGIVCPYARKGRPCCGGKEELQNLYKRLPKEDKKHFEEPDCDRIR